MNEFTKSELQEMKDSIFYHEEEYIGECKNPLVAKIQRMIDSYCDHKGLIDEQMDYCRCRQCGEKWEIEN